MIRIAITGGIACGKSLVGEIFSAAGVPVCDADDLAHSVMVSGTAVYNRIKEEFGDGVIADDGEIDRQKLGKLVFANEDARLILNGLVHPAVEELFGSWLSEHDSDRAAAVVIPLLYEAGMENGWDAIVCVACSRDIELQRLKDRNLTVSEAIGRISAQLPVETKMKRADFVIFNDGTVSMLKKQVGKVLRHILER